MGKALVEAPGVLTGLPSRDSVNISENSSMANTYTMLNFENKHHHVVRECVVCISKRQTCASKATLQKRPTNRR